MIRVKFTLVPEEEDRDPEDSTGLTEEAYDTLCDALAMLGATNIQFSQSQITS